MGVVLEFRRPATVEEAWERYDAASRAMRDLYDAGAGTREERIEACKRAARAWDEFTRLYLAPEASK